MLILGRLEFIELLRDSEGRSKTGGRNTRSANPNCYREILINIVKTYLIVLIAWSCDKVDTCIN